jgi:hypothetical protein
MTAAGLCEKWSEDEYGSWSHHSMYHAPRTAHHHPPTTPLTTIHHHRYLGTVEERTAMKEHERADISLSIDSIDCIDCIGSIGSLMLTVLSI